MRRLQSSLAFSSTASPLEYKTFLCFLARRSFIPITGSTLHGCHIVIRWVLIIIIIIFVVRFITLLV